MKNLKDLTAEEQAIVRAAGWQWVNHRYPNGSAYSAFEQVWTTGERLGHDSGHYHVRREEVEGYVYNHVSLYGSFGARWVTIPDGRVCTVEVVKGPKGPGVDLGVHFSNRSETDPTVEIRFTTIEAIRNEVLNYYRTFMRRHYSERPVQPGLEWLESHLV